VSRIFIAFSLSTAVFLLIACSKPDEERSPLARAYKHLDRSENAKAITLLEEIVKNDPGNEEAQILLSSAFLGAAGLNIYETYNTFRDLLFDQSLGEVFFKKPKLVKEPNPQGPTSEAVLERFFYAVDFFLTQLRNTVHFLNRFPHVKRHQWSLLDEALVHLEVVTPSREISTYRLFLRVVYLKSYFDVEWVRNQEVGSREWFCELKVVDLKDKLLWVLDHSSEAILDLKRVYPKRAPDWEEALATVDEVRRTIEDQNSPAGSYSGLMLLEANLKGKLKCGE
jgi:hypothetical protein